MRRIKQLRGLLLAFSSGLMLGNLDFGTKVCIIVPLLILHFISADDVLFKKFVRKV